VVSEKRLTGFSKSAGRTRTRNERPTSDLCTWFGVTIQVAAFRNVRIGRKRRRGNFVAAAEIRVNDREGEFRVEQVLSSPHSISV